jgi:hypothetical protein
MIIRYLIMLRVHKYKIRFIHKLKKNISSDSIEKSEKIQQILVRFLKLISSQYSYLVFPAIWGVIYFLIIITLYGITSFECRTTTQFYFRLSYAMGLLFFVVLISITMMIDLFLNLGNFFKCRWKRYFFDDDPFHFRFDMYFCLPIIPLTLIWALVPFSLYIKNLLVELIIVMGFWLIIGQTLTITILKYFYYKFKQTRKESKLSLNEIFSNEDLTIIFVQYSQSEWASENVLFRIDVEKYLKTPPSERYKICQTIKTQYLEFSKSPLEINAIENHVNEVVNKMNMRIFDDNLFEVLMKTVNMNLSDTLSRFIFSSFYSNYLLGLKEKEKELGCE